MSDDPTNSSEDLQILGPCPLIRVENQKLEVQSAGSDLLKKLPPYPTTVVFAIGGSRVGKSTVGNKLLVSEKNRRSSVVIGPNGFSSLKGHSISHTSSTEAISPRATTSSVLSNLATPYKTNDSVPVDDLFPIGHGFAHVTDGIDVACRVEHVAKRTLVYCDCEGSFHPTGSETNSNCFGLMGVLAYCCADWLLHISLGNLDERDIENLAQLGASARKHIVGNTGTSLTSDRDTRDGATSASKLKSNPNLMVLINAPRFEDLASDPQKTLGKAFDIKSAGNDDARDLSRQIVQKQFRDRKYFSLPPLTNQSSYCSQVLELRRELHSCIQQGKPVTASRYRGNELPILFQFIVDELNGQSKLVKPESAVDQVAKVLYLEPLVEKLVDTFEDALTRSTAENGGPHALRQARLTQETLQEYDKEIAQVDATYGLKSGIRSQLQKKLKKAADSVHLNVIAPSSGSSSLANSVAGGEGFFHQSLASTGPTPSSGIPSTRPPLGSKFNAQGLLPGRTYQNSTPNAAGGRSSYLSTNTGSEFVNGVKSSYQHGSEGGTPHGPNSIAQFENSEDAITMNARIQELEQRVQRVTQSETEEMQLLLSKVKDVTKSQNQLKSLGEIRSKQQSEIQELQKRLEELIAITSNSDCTALKHHSDALYAQTQNLAAEQGLLKSKNRKNTSVNTPNSKNSISVFQSLHAEASIMRKKFGELETSLASTGDVLMRAKESMDQRFAETEAELRLQASDREGMKNRFAKTLMAKQEELIEMIKEEKHERLMRESISAKMVQAVSEWLEANST